MRKLLLGLSILFSVYAIAAPCGNEEKGKACSKDKKCCKSGAAQGKACCKGKTGAAGANAAPANGTETAAAADAANQAPAGKACCKGKTGDKKCAGHGH
ncbi:MAG: hypothetical protein IPK03_10475 [Bacteroidetes bacterium]|jgi:hypothetical protein|nr:hypothetical protein [Bacteroidota bacterium]MBP7478143.1 hypothetical protein [Chitinophagales bacterium]